MKIKNDKIIIKIICALVAVILWALVMIETNPIIEKDINNISVTINGLSYLEKNEKTLMDNKDGYKINIKLRGKNEDLVKITSKDIVANVDVSSLNVGSNKVSVTIGQIPNVEIVGTNYITCNVEDVISASLDVFVKFEGTQAENYYVGNCSSNPDTIIIKGPRSVVDTAKNALAIVNVDGSTETTIKNVPLRIYTSSGVELSSLTATPSVVEATVPIYPIKTVTIKPTYTGMPRDGYKMVGLTSEISTIRIAGPKGLLENINELETEPIDITDAMINVVSNKKVLTNNPQIIIVDDASQFIKVSANIEKIISKDFIFDFDEIKFLNLNENYIVKSAEDNQTITVTVKAVSSIINQLSKADITLTADLISISDGNNEVKLEVNIKDIENLESFSTSVENVKFIIESKSTEEDGDNSNEEGE